MRSWRRAIVGLILLPTPALGQLVAGLLYVSSQYPASVRGLAYVCDPLQGNPPCFHPKAAILNVRFCVDSADPASPSCFDDVASSSTVVPGNAHGYSTVIPAPWQDGAVHGLHAFVQDPATLLWTEQQSSPDSFQFD